MRSRRTTTLISSTTSSGTPPRRHPTVPVKRKKCLLILLLRPLSLFLTKEAISVGSIQQGQEETSGLFAGKRVHKQRGGLVDISEIVNRIAPKVGGASGLPWPSLLLLQPSLSLHLSFYLSVSPSVFICLSNYLSVPLFVSLGLGFSVILSVIRCLSSHLSVYLTLNLSVPQHGRPEVVEPTLQRWIGDSAAIPCTPDVQAPKAKKKSPRWVLDWWCFRSQHVNMDEQDSNSCLLLLEQLYFPQSSAGLLSECPDTMPSTNTDTEQYFFLVLLLTI